MSSNAIPLLQGDDQTPVINSYLGFDFYSADGETDWKMFIAVVVDTTGNGFNDTTQLIRYDYSLSGSAVLSNPMVIATAVGTNASSDAFVDVAVVGDLVYLSHADNDGAVDRIRVFRPDGVEQTALVADLSAPRQINGTFDGGLAIVDFPLERFRITDLASGTTRREYILGDGSNSGNDRLRGVIPLRNGDYLVSGLTDINRVVVNRYSGAIRAVPDDDGSSGQLFGRACVPQTP